MNPEESPSGKKASGYAEFHVRVWALGPESNPFKSAECIIESAPDVPYPFLMIAAENMAASMARNSDAGFERALELLVEGAIENQTVKGVTNTKPSKGPKPERSIIYLIDLEKGKQLDSYEGNGDEPPDKAINAATKLAKETARHHVLARGILFFDGQ